MKTSIIVITAVMIAAITASVAVTLPNNVGDTEMDQEPETVYLAPGEVWVLSLDENPTTGYVWSVISSKGLNVTDSYEPATKDKDVVGAGGIHEYRISADESGEYEFSVKYARSWESTEYDKVVSVKLIVGDDI